MLCTNRLLWHTNSDFYGMRTPTFTPYELFFGGWGWSSIYWNMLWLAHPSPSWGESSQQKDTWMGLRHCLPAEYSCRVDKRLACPSSLGLLGTSPSKDLRRRQHQRDSHLEGLTRKPRHACVFSTHSDTQAVSAFHCTWVFKGSFCVSVRFFKRTDTLSTNA